MGTLILVVTTYIPCVTIHIVAHDPPLLYKCNTQHSIMTVAIIGKRTPGIDGVQLVFNSKTFLNDIQPYDTLIYIGEDNRTLKLLTIGMRTAQKLFIYIGGLDASYAMKKYPKMVVYRNVSDYPQVKKVVPKSIDVVDKKVMIDPIVSESIGDVKGEAIKDETTTTRSFLSSIL